MQTMSQPLSHADDVTDHLRIWWEHGCVHGFGSRMVVDQSAIACHVLEGAFDLPDVVAVRDALAPLAAYEHRTQYLARFARALWRANGSEGLVRLSTVAGALAQVHDVSTEAACTLIALHAYNRELVQLGKWELEDASVSGAHRTP